MNLKKKIEKILQGKVVKGNITTYKRLSVDKEEIDKLESLCKKYARSVVPEKESSPSGYKLCSKCGKIHCGGFEWNKSIDDMLERIK